VGIFENNKYEEHQVSSIEHRDATLCVFVHFFGMVQSWVAASKPALLALRSPIVSGEAGSEVEWAQLGDGKAVLFEPCHFLPYFSCHFSVGVESDSFPQYNQ